jgi:hypothetical protein
MPVMECKEEGKPGYKYGESGRCYTYTAGDEAGRKRAKQKAYIQGAAISSRTGEPMHKEDAAVFQEMLDSANNLEKSWDKFIDDGEGLIIEYPEKEKSSLSKAFSEAVQQIEKVMEKGMDVEDVHVATPGNKKKELTECEKAKRRGEGCPKIRKASEIMKMDDDKRLIYGLVLVPDVEDLQGDIVSKEEIESACHDYLVNSRLIKAQHRAPTDAEVVECYIAPMDIPLGKGIAPQGSWIMVTKVHSNAMWAAVKKGDITGYSIGGIGTREPMEE